MDGPDSTSVVALRERLATLAEKVARLQAQANRLDHTLACQQALVAELRTRLRALGHDADRSPDADPGAG